MLSRVFLATTFAVASAVSADNVATPIDPSSDSLFPGEVLIPQLGDSPLPIAIELYDCFSSSSDVSKKIAGIDSITFNYPQGASEGSVAIQYWNKYIDESTISELTLYMDTPESSVETTLPFALILFKLNEMKGQIADAVNGNDFSNPWLPVNPVTTTLAPILATTAPVKEQARVPDFKLFPIEATAGSVTFTKNFTAPAIDSINGPAPTEGQGGDSSGAYGDNYEPGNGQQGIIVSGEYNFAVQGSDADGNELFCFHAYANVPAPYDAGEATESTVEPTSVEPTSATDVPSTTKFLR